MFTFSAVGKDEWRGLKRVVQVPTIDFSQFISDNFEITDEVVLKMDIEGAEYAVINKMLNDGTFKGNFSSCDFIQITKSLNSW